ncbi:uncharacterized protein DS421_16g548370 [Arachis hypogaea]|nr:uncharacterized protein DS421_16g548370 [Arachis hypogaea]
MHPKFEYNTYALLPPLTGILSPFIAFFFFSFSSFYFFYFCFIFFSFVFLNAYD